MAQQALLLDNSELEEVIRKAVAEGIREVIGKKEVLLPDPETVSAADIAKQYCLCVESVRRIIRKPGSLFPRPLVTHTKEMRFLKSEVDSYFAVHRRF